MANPEMIFVEFFGNISALESSFIYIIWKRSKIFGGTSSPIFDLGPRFGFFKIEFYPYCIYGESWNGVIHTLKKSLLGGRTSSPIFNLESRFDFFKIQF